tara:strand:+ start:537 stop:2081 length:1545 start_codon:yes stop_codon:yes gene_type:complete
MSSKIISLVPTNGTEFSVTEGQKVIFELPPNLGLVKGRDCYLALDVLNNSADGNRLGLDQMAGASALINRVDIYSLRDGTHLETLQHYNQMISYVNQYLFQDKTNLQSLEGCGKDVYAEKFDTAGAHKNTELSVNHVEDAILSPINATTGATMYSFRRYTLPLKAGLFAWWNDERLCPVAAFGGLRIELTLESPDRAFHQLQTAALTATDTPADLSPDSVAADQIACIDRGANYQSIRTDKDVTIEKLGLSVGNSIEITDNNGSFTRNITTLAVSNTTKVEITFDGAQRAAGTGITVHLASISRAAKIKPQFRIVSVAPPENFVSRISGGFQYQFTTWDYHTSTIISTSTQHQVELNSVATKALAIQSSFVNNAEEKKEMFSSYFAGSAPRQTNLNSYQYFINNRLMPVRSVNPQPTEHKVTAMNELKKTWDSVSREAQDFGNDDGKNLEKYTNSFLIGRQLAKKPYYYDLKDSEGQIRLGFSSAPGANYQVNTFVWNNKVVNVGAGAELNVLL